MAGFRPRLLRPRRSPERARAGERGFVLIAAIWLLILAGSIAAVLMLRSLAASTAAAGRSDAAERRLALDSAIETMLAERLFYGNKSAWWRVPAQGGIAIGARTIALRVTGESGRIDLNAADPALIDAALRGFGVAAGERAAIVVRIQALRARKKKVGSPADLDQVLAGARPWPGTCLADQFTFVSGLAEPRPDQVPLALARALGGRGGATGQSEPAELEPGAALRIEAAEPGTAPIMAIVRIAGQPDRPIEISAWGLPHPCAAGAAGARS